MKGFMSFRGVVSLVALATLGLARPAAAEKPGDCSFRVSGTFQVVSARGSKLEVAVSGHATPGGRFTGIATGPQLPNGDVKSTVTLDFGGDDTLTYRQVLENDPETGLIVGTYEITGGTGRFEGASGSGSNVIDPAGDGTGEFELAGTLC